MIDLHSHILHGLDDGPPDLNSSVSLARAARSAGTGVLTATPHIRDDHPFPLEAISERTDELRAALARESVHLGLETGGELAITKAPDLDDDSLRSLCLGGGPYLLVESPYTHAPELLEKVLFELQARGFRPVLAHPERSPSFLSDFVRLARIVERGVLCSVTALSMSGAFGQAVRAFTARLFAEGMVHNVASDTHDEHYRPPGLGHGFARLEGELQGLAEQRDWYTRAVPAAILQGHELPATPPPPALGQKGWRRLFDRLRGSPVGA